MIESATPENRSFPVWPVPRSLATTYGISFDFSSWGYLDVSVRPVFPRNAMDSRYDAWQFIPCGFPHSEIHGSRDMCSSPWLIAACHVLRRRPVPRHSPCALSNLTYSHTLSCMRLWFFLSSNYPKHMFLRRSFKTRFLLSVLVSTSTRLQDLNFSFVFSLSCYLVFVCSCQGTMESLIRLIRRPSHQADAFRKSSMVETVGVEPATSCLQGRRSPN